MALPAVWDTMTGTSFAAGDRTCKIAGGLFVASTGTTPPTFTANQSEGVRVTVPADAANDGMVRIISGATGAYTRAAWQAGLFWRVRTFLPQYPPFLHISFAAGAEPAWTQVTTNWGQHVLQRAQTAAAVSDEKLLVQFGNSAKYNDPIGGYYQLIESIAGSNAYGSSYDLCCVVRRAAPELVVTGILTNPWLVELWVKSKLHGNAGRGDDWHPWSVVVADVDPAGAEHALLIAIKPNAKDADAYAQVIELREIAFGVLDAANRQEFDPAYRSRKRFVARVRNGLDITTGPYDAGEGALTTGIAYDRPRDALYLAHMDGVKEIGFNNDIRLLKSTDAKRLTWTEIEDDGEPALHYETVEAFTVQYTGAADAATLKVEVKDYPLGNVVVTLARTGESAATNTITTYTAKTIQTIVDWLNTAGYDCTATLTGTDLPAICLAPNGPTVAGAAQSIKEENPVAFNMNKPVWAGAMACSQSKLVLVGTRWDTISAYRLVSKTYDLAAGTWSEEIELAELTDVGPMHMIYGRGRFVLSLYAPVQLMHCAGDPSVAENWTTEDASAINANEPALAMLPDGTIVAALRDVTVETGWTAVAYCWTTDWGATWSDVRKFDGTNGPLMLAGSDPIACCVSNGYLFLFPQSAQCSSAAGLGGARHEIACYRSAAKVTADNLDTVDFIPVDRAPFPFGQTVSYPFAEASGRHLWMAAARKAPPGHVVLFDDPEFFAAEAAQGAAARRRIIF